MLEKDEQRKLDRALRLAEENNSLLQKIRRTQVVSRWIKIVYWLIIIGIAIGAFYFIQPVLDEVRKGLTEFKESADSVPGLDAILSIF